MSEDNRSANLRTSFVELLDFVVDLVKVVIVSFAIIFPVRYFLVQPFYVKGASMEPTFKNNEYLLVDEISYRFEDPTRGQVVVFHNPKNPKDFFIKRIIGLPGDTVRISNGHVKVYKDDILVSEKEPYLATELPTIGDFDVLVPSNHFFVLGDNRNNSLDSRSIGAVPERYLVGRVWIRAWPLDRAIMYTFDEIPGLE